MRVCNESMHFDLGTMYLEHKDTAVHHTAATRTTRSSSKESGVSFGRCVRTWSGAQLHATSHFVHHCLASPGNNFHSFWVVLVPKRVHAGKKSMAHGVSHNIVVRSERTTQLPELSRTFHAPGSQPCSVRRSEQELSGRDGVTAALRRVSSRKSLRVNLCFSDSIQFKDRNETLMRDLRSLWRRYDTILTTECSAPRIRTHVRSVYQEQVRLDGERKSEGM